MKDLPYDILLIIFKFAALQNCKCNDPICRGDLSIPLSEAYLYRGYHVLYSYSFTILYRLMSVCSLWHTTIVESPVFWTFIGLPLMKPDLVTLFLERARDAPLEVSVSIHAETNTETILEYIRRFLICNMHRVGTLAVQANNRDPISVIPNIPAPLLRTLLILMGNEVTRLATANLDFALLAPSLENITLCRCIMPIPTNSFRNLRRLIHNPLRISSDGWSVHDALRVLSHCRHTLEELELLTTRKVDSKAYWGLSILNLPKLKRLIWYTTIDYPNLLLFISAPQIRTLQILDIDGLMADGSTIVPTSFTELSSRKPSVLEMYQLALGTAFGINLYADRDRNEKLFASCFKLKRHFLELTHFLEAFLRKHGLLSVKHVRYSADSPEVLIGMRKIIDLMPCVEEPELWKAKV